MLVDFGTNGLVGFLVLLLAFMASAAISCCIALLRMLVNTAELDHADDLPELLLLQVEVLVAQPHRTKHLVDEVLCLHPAVELWLSVDTSHLVLKAVTDKYPILIIGQHTMHLGKVVLQAKHSEVLEELRQMTLEVLSQLSEHFLAWVLLYLLRFEHKDRFCLSGTVSCVSLLHDHVVRPNSHLTAAESMLNTDPVASLPSTWQGLIEPDDEST